MEGETVLCVSPRGWDALWKETQAIMSRLAPRNRILYFEPGRDSESGVVSEMRRNCQNLFRLTVKEVRRNLYVIPSPPVLPHGRRHLPRFVLRLTMPIAISVNARVLIAHVRRAMAALEVTAPILWLSDPYHVELIGKFGEKLVCYYNFDEFADFTDNRRVSDLIRQRDQELSRRADVVFATSRSQWERRKAINRHTYLVPNAVDFELFNRALIEEAPVPCDIGSVPRPIIGYAGWLAGHIDVPLLRRVAEAYPRYSMVLVGPDQLPASRDRDALCRLPNVFFLGRKKRAELPDYLRSFDVALIPYRLAGHVLSGYPTKLHEYLAAGRAVVATAMPELEPYCHVIRLAQSHEDFIRHIGDAFLGRSPEAIQARVAVAQGNTWDQRVADISRILAPLLEEKKISV